MKPLTDRYGRVHDYLRISLTPSCNLRCGYCRPAKPSEAFRSRALLTNREVVRLARILVNRFGIRKIRLTGGEPLVRKGFPSLLASLAELPVKLAITTNGVLLKNHFSLFEAVGLHSLNVSLDSLHAGTYRRITGRDLFHTVHENIEDAVARGFSVKVNTVLLRGVNDAEWLPFVEWTRRNPLHVRFIEFMPFAGNGWRRERVVAASEILEQVRCRYPVERLTDRPGSTCESYRVTGFAGTFAFIGSVTKPFCSTCNRLRLLSDGRLTNCLFARRETDLLEPLRRGADLSPLIQRCVFEKEAARGGQPLFDDISMSRAGRPARSMTATGG